MQSDLFLEALTAKVRWKHEEIRLFGKMVKQPRLTAWYADPGKTYTYSGLTVTPEPWISELLEIKKEVEVAAHAGFNSVLLNFYRNERDSVSWHSDDEPELGENPVIGSVSFGAPRCFQLKHKKDNKLRSEILLTHGSLLLMKGPTQHHWLHQIPKKSKPCGPRINLTFRKI